MGHSIQARSPTGCTCSDSTGPFTITPYVPDLTHTVPGGQFADADGTPWTDVLEQTIWSHGKAQLCSNYRGTPCIREGDGKRGIVPAVDRGRTTDRNRALWQRGAIDRHRHSRTGCAVCPRGGFLSTRIRSGRKFPIALTIRSERSFRSYV
jgi:hypothetical protein